MNNNEPIILGKVKKGSAGKPLLDHLFFFCQLYPAILVITI